MGRLLRSTRTWNPMMWTGLTGMTTLILVGSDNSTLIGAAIMFMASCTAAFLVAASIVATFSDAHKEQEL